MHFQRMFADIAREGHVVKATCPLDVLHGRCVDGEVSQRRLIGMTPRNSASSQIVGMGRPQDEDAFDVSEVEALVRPSGTFTGILVACMPKPRTVESVDALIILFQQLTEQ
jgi:hypothetical protein